jgi:hypothetical protein
MRAQSQAMNRFNNRAAPLLLLCGSVLGFPTGVGADKQLSRPEQRSVRAKLAGATALVSVTPISFDFTAGVRRSLRSPRDYEKSFAAFKKIKITEKRVNGFCNRRSRGTRMARQTPDWHMLLVEAFRCTMSKPTCGLALPPLRFRSTWVERHG